MNEKCWHTNSPNLLEELNGKWVIFDTSAINRIIENEADNFWGALKGQSVIPCYIDPIALELQAHGDAAERARRLEAISELTPLSLLPQDLQFASQLQNELHSVTSKDCKPSPTDLYIGAVAARFGYGRLLIATENTTDFPKPYFERLGYVILEDKLRVKTIAILRVSEDTKARVG